MANLFIDVLRSYSRDKRFKVHEFVVMRNYVQLLVTLTGEATVEEIARRMKARFAFRAVAEIGIKGWIWAYDITAVRVGDQASYLKQKAVIEAAPVKAGMASSGEEYPYCSAYLRKHAQRQTADPAPRD